MLKILIALRSLEGWVDMVSKCVPIWKAEALPTGQSNIVLTIIIIIIIIIIIVIIIIIRTFL